MPTPRRRPHRAAGGPRDGRRTRLPHGFTLVELLIVIAILIALIGILVPVVGHARRQAERTKCANNLATLGKAMVAYAGEHNSYLPTCGAQNPILNSARSSDWTGWGGIDATNMCDYLEECALAKYLGTETPGNQSQLNTKLRANYLCPSVSVDRGSAPYPFDYSMNAQFSGFPLERVQDAGQKALLVEPVNGYVNGTQKFASSAYFYDGASLPNVGVQSVQGQIDTKRHGPNNTLFADWHVGEFDLSHQNDSASDSRDSTNAWRYWDAYVKPIPPATVQPNQPKNAGYGAAQ